MNESQRDALRQLADAFDAAGKCDLLGLHLQPNCDNPESINDVISAIQHLTEGTTCTS